MATRTWAELERCFLSNFDRCDKCGGKATHVDHRRHHHGDAERFFDPDNLVSLCRRCFDAVERVDYRVDVAAVERRGRKAK